MWAVETDLAFGDEQSFLNLNLNILSKTGPKHFKLVFVAPWDIFSMIFSPVFMSFSHLFILFPFRKSVSLSTDVTHCSHYWPYTKIILDQVSSDSRRVNLASQWSFQVLNQMLAGPLFWESFPILSCFFTWELENHILYIQFVGWFQFKSCLADAMLWFVKFCNLCHFDWNDVIGSGALYIDKHPVSYSHTTRVCIVQACLRQSRCNSNSHVYML